MQLLQIQILGGGNIQKVSSFLSFGNFILPPLSWFIGLGQQINKISNLLMDKAMQHYNQYTTQSNLSWEGITSSKFPKPRLIHQKRDIIKTGLQLPDQELRSTRKHFQPQRSGEFVFKPILKQVGEMEHWHLRPSCKKILDLQFSQPHPRRERSHYQQPLFQHQDKYAGIRTFYNTRLADGITEYSLEDRMQRKVRVDQLSLRKNAFKTQSLLMSSQFKNMKF